MKIHNRRHYANATVLKYCNREVLGLVPIEKLGWSAIGGVIP